MPKLVNQRENGEQLQKHQGFEDYFGYYESTFLPSLQQAIDDMLAEFSLHMFTKESEDSPVGLLNEAWQKFDTDHDAYLDWETQAIETFLNENPV